MAYLGESSDFEIDDDGILRDNSFHLDDDGILRDDFDVYTKAAGGHWTDSGFGGDKHSSQSTLRHINTSFDDDSQHNDERSLHISEFEASKDDLDLDQYSTGSAGSDRDYQLNIRQSYDDPLRLRESSDWFQKPASENRDDLFTDSYYQELRDLGVLVDGQEYDQDQNEHLLLDLTDLDKSYSHENLYLEHDQVKDPPKIIVSDEPAKSKDVRNVSHDRHRSRRLPDTRSNSTVSSRSFPEITPEEAEELYTNKSYKYVDKSAAFDFYNSTGNSKEDDDEIFFITSRIPSSKLNNLKESVSPNPSNTSTRATSPLSYTSSRPHSPYSREIWTHQNQTPEVKKETENEVQFEDLHVDIPERANTATPTEPKSQRPLSSSSHLSTGSENLSSRSKKLPKAVSQESFFDMPKTPKSEKMPKRILPKPNAIDEEQYQIKCKSTTNISGKSGPVKPTHMTISEITRITMDEVEEGDGKTKGEHVELSTKLKQEFNKRKQATELVQQLQKDYDSLLSKYALAELTIDQMRLGAKINLYSDSPVPNQIQFGGLSTPQSVQMINLGGTPSRGLLSASPSSTNRYFSPGVDGSEIYTSNSVLNGMVGDSRSGSCNDKLIGGNDVASDGQILKAPAGAQQVKTALLAQTKTLDQRIQSFENIVNSNQLSVEEKEQVFNKIRSDHEKLRRQYLQSKEDYNVLRRSGATATDANFDENKELEGELFKLGMKFDEIHQEVDSHFKESKEQRQPFQSNRLADDDAGENGFEIDEHGTENAVDQLKQRMYNSTAGNDLIHARPNEEFENKLQRLHEEYNALMDRYRRLKQMAPTPDTEKEIDNLVKKLKLICDEAPQIFHLPPELDERMEKLAKKEQENKNRRASPQVNGRLSPYRNGSHHGNTSTGLQLNGINDESIGRIESSNLKFTARQPSPHLPGEGRNHGNTASFNQRREPASSGSNTDIRGRRSPGASTSNGRYSPGGTLLPNDRNRHPNSRNYHDRYSDRGSDSSDSPRDNGTGGRVARPRRHDHEFHDRKLKKKTNGGSMNSLPDSGISDQGEGASALAKLPGPGKFKQMTRQHGADDVDSGFVGSLVGLGQEAGQPNLQHQQEETLRLQHPAGQERPSSRHSNRSQSSRHHDQDASSQGPNQDASSQSLYQDASSQGLYQDASSQSLQRRSSLENQSPSQIQRPSSAQKQTSSQTQRPSSAQKQLPYQTQRPSSAQKQSSSKTQRPSSAHSSRRSSFDRYDEAGQTLDLTYEEDSELSDVSTRPQRSDKMQSGNRKRQQNNHKMVDSEDDDSDATPRSQTVFKDKEEHLIQHSKPQNNRSSSKPLRGRHSFSSGEITPTETPRGRQTRGRYSLDSVEADILPQRLSPQKLKSAVSNQMGPLSKKTQRENARALRNLTTLGPPSDHSEILNDAASDTTRASSIRSTRLRALQEQIEQLRESMGLVNNQIPPPVPAPNEHQGPEYYDPFDDPYGFMRMPRRRANSFSGRGEREFDEWYWTLPNQRQHDDIPLGYAAADAFADRPPPHTAQQAATANPVRARIQQRRQETGKRRSNEDTVPVLGNGYSSDPNIHIPSATHANYNSRINKPHAQLQHQIASPSKYSTASMRHQMASQGYFTTPSGAKIYASQVPPYSERTSYETSHNLRVPYTSAEFSPPLYQSRGPSTAIHNGYVSESGYQPRVYSLPQSSRPFVRIRRPYTQRVQDANTEHYFSDGGVLNRRSAVYVEPSACSMCGGTGEHQHGDLDDEPVLTESYRNSIRTIPLRRQSISRRRSRSVPRLRPYDRHRYRYSSTREYSDASSAESDDSLVFTPRRRSRSLSRSRSIDRRTRRSYNRSRAFSDNEFSVSDDEGDLNDSLILSENIKKLTRKMKKEVKGELRKYHKHRDMALSDW